MRAVSAILDSASSSTSQLVLSLTDICQEEMLSMMMRDAIVVGSLEIPWHTGTIHRYVRHDDEGCYNSRKLRDTMAYSDYLHWYVHLNSPV